MEGGIFFRPKLHELEPDAKIMDGGLRGQLPGRIGESVDQREEVIKFIIIHLDGPHQAQTSY